MNPETHRHSTASGSSLSAGSLSSDPGKLESASKAPAQFRQPLTLARLISWWLAWSLFVWMFLACCFPLYDTDLFWHLAAGEYILQTGTIPGYDLYTYTDYGKRWIDLHWGFQIGAALVYRLGGADLLILVKAGILTLALGIAFHAGGTSLPPWARVGCWVLPAIAISGRGYERPEIITVTCLATWLWIVSRLDRQPRLIWCLPVLQVFWINCHALFVLGLVVGACLAADYGCRWLAVGRWGLALRSASLRPWTVFWAGGLCALAAFANPYLEEGALFPLILFRKFTVEQQFYSAQIGEFQRPIEFLWKHGLINLYLNAEVALWGLAAGSFVWLGICRQVSPFRALLFTAFSYLAWKASRNTNIFAIVSGYVLAENLHAALQQCRLGPSAETSLTPWNRRLNFASAVLLLLMSVAVVSGTWNRWAEKIRPFRLGETVDWYPHAAARFMNQTGFPDRVFAAQFGAASVYTYYNQPRGRVFMDGRLEVCTKATFKRYLTASQLMMQGDPAWMQLVRDENGALPAVLLDSRFSRPLIAGMMHMPGWRLVFADKSAAVFIQEPVAEVLKLQAADPQPLIEPPKNP